MARALLCWENEVVLATALTAGSEQAGLTVGNLQSQHGSTAFGWRTAQGVTASWFQVDSGSTTQTWRAFALARTNLTTGATWRVRVGTVSGFASGTVYDSGTISANIVAGIGQAVLGHTAAVTGRYCRIDITDAGNPDGYLAIPLAYAGPAFEPGINFSPETAFSLRHEQQIVRTRGGGMFVAPLYTERAWSLHFDALLTSELWAQVVPANLAAADGRNVLFIPDPASANASREAVFGPLTTEADIGFTTLDGNRRNWRARIVERL